MPVFGGVGGAQAFGPASGGKVTPLNNVGTSFAQVIGANPSRLSIGFHNPGTITLYVGPLVTASGSANSPSSGSLGGAFILPPGTTQVFTGECQTAWGAFAVSGTTNPLSVVESNIA